MGRTLESLIGKSFGMLTVTEQAQSSPSGKRRWVCVCECGKQTVTSTRNLTTGHTKSCGCIKYNDLTGQRIGRLTVLRRSDKRGSRGSRQATLWECRCDCGAITYKATDTLTNPDLSMCNECAGKYAAAKMRENAGFVDGTQISRIKTDRLISSNTSGVRGVYFDKRSGKWRARLKFKGKLMNFGTYSNFDDAVKARKQAEQEIYGEFLEQIT